MIGADGINRAAAESLFARFAPMFAEFERRGIDYCLVGGLAVVVQCLAHGSDRFRATVDADAMVPQDFVDVGILGALAEGDAREEGADSGILARIGRIFGER